MIHRTFTEIYECTPEVVKQQLLKEWENREIRFQWPWKDLILEYLSIIWRTE